MIRNKSIRIHSTIQRTRVGSNQVGSEYVKSKRYLITFFHVMMHRQVKYARLGYRKLQQNALTSKNSPQSMISPIDFQDYVSAYQSKTLPDLIRNLIVFSICQMPFIVKRSESLMRYSYRFLGRTLTNSFLQVTFFGHFCAGENEVTIRPTVDYLQRNGIGSILDYAAESDINATNKISTSDRIIQSKSGVQCRVYDYRNEEMCDLHQKTFEKCIQAVKAVSPTGFAAIKCTALCNPELLKRASVALVELRKLFLKFDSSNTGLVTKEQFYQAYDRYFKGGNVSSVFEKCDVDGDGLVDYIEWSNALELEELHLLTAYCRETGPLTHAVLDEVERDLMKRMRQRIDELASLAQSLGVRLMIDAEHTYFQPAIDNITIGMTKKYNQKFPAIFGTYQMYLKDSKQRLLTDMNRAKKGNYKFAAKLVRGAYMVLERGHAKEHGLPDPIHDTIQATHDNYNESVQEVLKAMATGQQCEVMIASHNQRSIESALISMQKYNLPPSSGVYFGQLLGMSDHLTFSLGAGGYKAYKYVPYGIIEEVMPYLIRRAQENSDALSGAKTEIKMIRNEIIRRLSWKKQE